MSRFIHDPDCALMLDIPKSRSGYISREKEEQLHCTCAERQAQRKAAAAAKAAKLRGHVMPSAESYAQRIGIGCYWTPARRTGYSS